MNDFDSRFIWCMFFSSVVSFQYHPGVKVPLSLSDCAVIADSMLDEFLNREDVLCRG